MKGIILAGGLGTRLYPSTLTLSKQLLPVYDKPMIYYPLCSLMQAGIRDILIITTPQTLFMFENLLGNGSQWGISISYLAQHSPDGIAQAFILAEQFIGQNSVALILGDNILYGDSLSGKLQNAIKKNVGATIFGYYVSDPERYGVIEFNNLNQPINIIEKPKYFISHYAVIGFYIYSNEVVKIAKKIKPSLRGELEITDVNLYYLKQKKLQIEILGRGTAWLDTGTHKSLLDASNFIYILEQRQGLKIGSPEEIAWRMNYISDMQLKQLTESHIKSGYGKYLLELMDFN